MEAINSEQRCKACPTDFLGDDACEQMIFDGECAKFKLDDCLELVEVIEVERDPREGPLRTSKMHVRAINVDIKRDYL